MIQGARMDGVDRWRTCCKRGMSVYDDVGYGYGDVDYDLYLKRIFNVTVIMFIEKSVILFSS
ncbi:predicted protein [Sclerotinia sclerotiorum 1980 UF-70]|uniref:Uncharacterized protein n=1 Tax=Sclerotinia sclerotiorum (strain ATCC 18683 / 1980 / Ss-1) TaxID=665079 RepID=A7F3H6_SCLS1|nr:predicted protein [Sclerotinia sclerotiorum 1980 UF-70]EDN97297.1 predicted protein [Sclerotinia sclerotiorum 1980 UF-70]